MLILELALVGHHEQALQRLTPENRARVLDLGSDLVFEFYEDEDPQMARHVVGCLNQIRILGS